jgi:2-polyprenyl-3-methyl-5-hydroxy-6-metoxy-1,4-benzoquinol methylase
MYKDEIESILRQETMRLHEVYDFPCDYAIPSISRQSVSFAQLMNMHPAAFEGKTVLEIGPYRTATALLFKRLGASKTRIVDGKISDLDIMQTIYEKEGIDFYRYNLSDSTNFSTLTVPGNNDLVICMEVIEHLNFNPIPFLRWLRSLLSPMGQLFLTAPNQAAPLSRARLMVGKSIATPINYFIEQMQPGNTKMHGVHWREYTAHDLSNLLSYCGFHKIKSGYVNIQDFKHKKGFIKNIGRKLLTFHSTIFYLGSPINNR